MTGPTGTAGLAPAPVSTPAGTGLLGKLLASVRPQFRVEVLVPDPADRVLGRPRCLAPGLRPVGLAARALRRSQPPLERREPPRP